MWENRNEELAAKGTEQLSAPQATGDKAEAYLDFLKSVEDRLKGEAEPRSFTTPAAIL